MTEKEIQEMLRKMDTTKRTEIVQALMAVQDATANLNEEEKRLVISMWAQNATGDLSAEEKVLVISMWNKNILAYKRVLDLIQCGE